MSSHKAHTPASIDYHINDLVIRLIVPGLALTTFLLLAFAYLAWNRTSRSHLNRVSFRLLVYALLANIVFTGTPLAIQTGPSTSCTVIAFAFNTAYLFSGCIFFCMAINLQLVLVHGVNGRMMEKYYLIGAFFLALVCNITTLAAREFGWYAANGTCWFNDPSPAVQVRWLIGAQSFWILLMATSEVVSFLVLVGFMLRHQRHTAHVHSASGTSQTFSGSVSPAPIVQYRNVIVRIGLYPLLSCCLNFSACILDLYLASHSGNSVLDDSELFWRLNILDLCIYSLRPFLYACLAATDPSFLRAVRALRSPGTELTSVGSTRSANGQQTASVQATSTRTSHSHKRFSIGTQALVHVELERVADAQGGAAEADLEGRPSRGMSVDTPMEEGAPAGEDPELGLQTGQRMQGLRFSEDTTKEKETRWARRDSDSDEIECQI
ncbi:hypothetical protein B0H17DRAFT_250049 [Mycena rosella]|uniref:G-protein coupled receptors family 2 profile 2 domain-containing protein n=1 Tax=Mycena rosella TaxID=1033263 RepID=A0AAD7H1E9_MYCRO|nr:hypothetical protein B0H17DRAFT_250049 [Mycena rosella]